MSFYTFTLPVLQSLLALSVTLLAVGTTVAIVSRYLYGEISSDGSKVVLTSRVRVHFGMLGALIALVAAGFLWLHRYDMLLAGNERFSGASFMDINVSLPGITILSLATVFITGLFALTVVKGLWKFMVIGIAVTVVAGPAVTTVTPYFVQRFQVVPSTAEEESIFIQRSINATPAAYGLDSVKGSGYKAQTDAAADQLRSGAEATMQTRVLDPSIISPILIQSQRNRPYYSLDQRLSVNRYTIKDIPCDTVIPIREFNLSGLSEG